MSEDLQTEDMATVDLRIPKREVPIFIRDVRGQEREVEVFLAEPSNPLARGERLQDLLSTRRFLPIKSEGEIEFYQAGHLLWMRIDVIEAFDELDPQAESSDDRAERAIVVELQDGSSLEGSVRYLLPEAARRLGDYLEFLQGPLPLFTTDWLYLVNPTRIVRIKPRQ